MLIISVTICHHPMPPQYHWRYSSCRSPHSCDLVIPQLEDHISYSLLPTYLSPNSGNHQCSLCICRSDSAFLLFIHFLKSIYKWNHIFDLFKMIIWRFTYFTWHNTLYVHPFSIIIDMVGATSIWFLTVHSDFCPFSSSCPFLLPVSLIWKD